MYAVYNYTELKIREKKIYSISGTTISSQGISANLIGTMIVTVSVGILLSFIVSAIIGVNVLNPMAVGPIGLLIFIGGGIASAFALLYVKIQHYRLLDYLIIYFRPKPSVSFYNTKVFHTKYTVKIIVEGEYGF